MRARTLGFDFIFLDGLAVDGLAPATGSTGDPTLVRLDPERVAHLPPAPDDGDPQRVLRIVAVGDDGWLLTARGVGAALVSADGRAVACAPVPGNEDWPALLAGQVLPLVATVRGHEVFHASGVVVADRARLLCAARGVGKTSLAVQLVLAGAQLLADDVVAVDGQLRAHPGPGVLHVRAPELTNLPDPDTSPAGPVDRRAEPGLRRSGEHRGRALVAVDRVTGRAWPLGGIYLLGRSRAGAPVVALPAPRPVDLLGATFNLSVRTPERLVRQLSLCARIAREVPVAQVRIVPGREAPELARALLADMTGDGATSR